MTEQLKVLGAMRAVVLAAPAVVLTYAAATEPVVTNTEPPPAATASIETAPNPEPPPSPPAAPSYSEPEEQPECQPVDSKELKDRKREMRDQLREITRTLKQAKKYKATAAEAKLTELKNFVADIQQKLQQDPTRCVLDDYYDARVWEELNPLRASIELPRELADLNKQFKRVEKKFKKRKYKVLGDELLGVLKGKFDEMVAAVAQAKQLFDQGEFEDAQEAKQTVHEDGGPWDVESSMDRLADLYGQMKRVRDPEIAAGLEEFLSPVKDSIKEGDLRGARESLDDVNNDLMRLIDQAVSVRGQGRQRDLFDQRLEKLEDLLERKMGEREAKSNSEKAPPPPSAPTPPAEFK